MHRHGLLGTLPFELVYLALLTRSRVKPLSRWEVGLTSAQIDALEAYGLEVLPIERSTLLGKRLPRVVFSTSRRRLDVYKKRFDGTRLAHSPEITRIEGRFFGYPSCCIEQFIEKPYVPNGLSHEDQRILFHWACPGCGATGDLLPDYRSIFRECIETFGLSAGDDPFGKRFPVSGPHGRTRLVRRVMPWAASIAAVTLLPGLSGALQGDPHRLPVQGDIDGDGLTYMEEVLMGGNEFFTDTDHNGIPDGVDESLYLHTLIDALPRTPQPDVPYAIEYNMDGVEQCVVCGEWVDMGYISIVHPVRGIVADVPFIAMHYLEHGSLGYDGTLHTGRVDVDLLKRILFPENPSHFVLNATMDSDGDQLEDLEEPLLSTSETEPDTDMDTLDDGPQVCERLLTAIARLPRESRSDGPYVVEQAAFGIETCSICGAWMNMGSVHIVNPIEEITMDLPYIALHYLAHGSLGYEGDVHDGRTLPAMLDAVIGGDGGAHLVGTALPDTDSDGLTDYEETELGLDSGDPDFDGDGIPDGRDVALALYDAVEHLPVGPLSDEPYKIHAPLRGLYQCLVCGEQINMGGMSIVDPVAGTSTGVSYYNLHFMKHGSLSTDRPSHFPRQDPAELADVLGLTVANVDPVPLAGLLSNAPNPFVSSTEISFSLPEELGVSVKVFDAAGRKVCELFTGRAMEGPNKFVWDGRDSSGRQVASGVYFCKLSAKSFVLKRKMLKLR